MVSVDSGLMHWKMHVYPKAIMPAIDIQQYVGGKDDSIADRYVPEFMAAKQHNVIVGIVAGHLTTPYMYRIKGLHVIDLLDFNAVGTALIGYACARARSAGARSIWALPDFSAEREILLQNGFVETETCRDGRLFLVKSL